MKTNKYLFSDRHMSPSDIMLTMDKLFDDVKDAEQREAIAKICMDFQKLYFSIRGVINTIRENKACKEGGEHMQVFIAIASILDDILDGEIGKETEEQ